MPLNFTLGLTMTGRSVECATCHEPLLEGQPGPCPKCGGTSRHWKVELHATSQVIASLRYLHTREYWEKHPVLLPLVLAIVVGSPFLGLVLAGWSGVLVGLFVSVVGFALGLFAVTKVRHTREGGS